jgi:signal transduction histidine kinase
LLIDGVRGFDFDGDPNIVEVYVGYLRKKLGRDAVRTVPMSVTGHWKLLVIKSVRFRLTAAEATLAQTSQRGTTNEEASELAVGVLAEATRMGTVVEDLLSLARHDEGLAPPGNPMDLDDVVLAETSRPRLVAIDASGVSAGRVRGRRDELGSVVTHLLDNACRHALSSVVVHLESVDGWVILSIEDDGPGIPTDQRELVFERFFRLDEARERDSGGAGLGLAVVASVIRASGGTVCLSDSGIGGARFEVRLPASS